VSVEFDRRQPPFFFVQAPDDAIACVNLGDLDASNGNHVRLARFWRGLIATNRMVLLYLLDDIFLSAGYTVKRLISYLHRQF